MHLFLSTVSMPGIAGVVMTLATVPGMEALGPRKFLFIILLPAGIPWLVQAFTPYLSLLYLGRVVSCFIYIALGPVTAVLVAEISEPRIRGLLLSAEEITVAIAQMAIYIMAHSLPWDVATAACAAPMILVAALTFFVPEVMHVSMSVGLFCSIPETRTSSIHFDTCLLLIVGVS